MQQRHIVSLKLNDNTELYGENVNEIDIRIGDKVVIHLEQNYDIAIVTSEERIVDDIRPYAKNLCVVVRKVNEQDIQRIRENEKRAEEAYKIIKKTCISYELPIKIVKSEYSFDRSKLYVYFTQENQVNLKKVITEFAHRFKARIEMRQIGPRDETKITGGIGVCGYELCCAKWIKKFESISVEMAKIQQLSLNIPKLSGVCNRLKCCLGYEYPFYKECVEKFPKIGSKVSTKDGQEGKVVGIDCLKELVNIEIKKEEGESIIKTFPLNQINI